MYSFTTTINRQSTIKDLIKAICGSWYGRFWVPDSGRNPRIFAIALKTTMALTNHSLTGASNKGSFEACRYDEHVHGRFCDCTQTSLNGTADTNGSHCDSETDSTNSCKENIQKSQVEDGPRRPAYECQGTRLESFQSWPLDHPMEPRILVKAGFYFTGRKDCTRCFHCGVGLSNWLPGDDAWVEHAKHFPRCAFVRRHKGNLFVDVVQDLEKKKDRISYNEVLSEMVLRK